MFLAPRCDSIASRAHLFILLGKSIPCCFPVEVSLQIVTFFIRGRILAKVRRLYQVDVKKYACFVHESIVFRGFL